MHYKVSVMRPVVGYRRHTVYLLSILFSVLSIIWFKYLSNNVSGHDWIPFIILYVVLSVHHDMSEIAVMRLNRNSSKNDSPSGIIKCINKKSCLYNLYEAII